MKCLPLIAIAIALTGAAGAAHGTMLDEQGSGKLATPPGWNYEIRNGQRVPKSNRITNPDGSWREESRTGSCVTIRERTADGEYKEVRRCD